MKISQTVAAIAAALLLAAPASAADKPIATVNGVVIPQAMADAFLAQSRANGQVEDAAAMARLRQELVDRELLFQAAKKAGVDKKPEVAARVDTAMRTLMAQVEATRQTLITRAYLEEHLKQHPVDDARLKQAYARHRAAGGDTEYLVRHILVKDEADAKRILAELKKGAPFDTLAKQSLDTPNQAQGGSLGWSSPARFAPEFGAALRTLKKGELAPTPVRTAYGYHVIRVDDTRPLKVPSFEELKPMLRTAAEAAAIEEVTAALRAKAVVR